MHTPHNLGNICRTMIRQVPVNLPTLGPSPSPIPVPLLHIPGFRWTFPMLLYRFCVDPPKPMSIESVMPSNHLILCHALLLPPSIFPSIKVFSNESALHIRWPKYWSFSFSISPSNEYSGLPRDGRAWWAAVYGVTQSRTRLKRLSSSSQC